MFTVLLLLTDMGRTTYTNPSLAARECSTPTSPASAAANALVCPGEACNEHKVRQRADGEWTGDHRDMSAEPIPIALNTYDFG